MTGFRVHEPRMRELGMSLPGFTDRAQALAELPALGVLNLAGVTPPNWTCSYRGVPVCSEEAVLEILGDKPDVVAISALTASVEEAYRLSGRLQAEGVYVVMGGLHVSSCPDEAMAHCDAVVVGRGERVWPELLADFDAGTLRGRYDAVRTEQPLWPMPRFDLLGHNPPRFTLQTQTGCPFSCGFCGSSRLLGRFHEKPVANIRAELAAIKKIQRRPLIELADDNTFAGNRDVNELFDVLQESGARWFTEADWRIGERPEVLVRLATSGCAQVLVGIESLVFRYPGMGEKQAVMDRMMDAACAIQEAGVAVNGCFIVGADGETQQSLEKLTQFILDCPLAEVQVTVQTPFPGTQLYRQLKADGRLLADRSWSSYSLFDVTYQPDQMTVEELEAGFRTVLRAVYGPEPTKRRNDIRRTILRRARALKARQKQP